MSLKRLKQLERGEFSTMRLGTSHIKAVGLGILHHHQFEVDLPKIVLFAGSNGKGSNVAIAEHLLQQQGYSIGCFTSPHLISLEERIRIKGQNIKKRLLLAAIALTDELAVKNCCEERLSFFEYIFLIALAAFRLSKMQVLLIEVGIGGRLDATNIVSPDASVFSSITLEHAQILGDTKSKIAYEKAGVSRFEKPAIVTLPEADLERELRFKGAKIVQSYKRVVQSSETVCDSIFTHYYFGARELMSQLQLDRQPIPSLVKTYSALQQSLQGRLQSVQLKKCTIVLDVAHNMESARRLAKHIAPMNKQFFATIAVSRDKAVEGFIEILSPYIAQWHLVESSHSRLYDSRSISHLIQQRKPEARIVIHRNFDLAYESIESQTGDTRSHWLITGSFYIVGPALQWLQNKRNT